MVREGGERERGVDNMVGQPMMVGGSMVTCSEPGITGFLL